MSKLKVNRIKVDNFNLKVFCKQFSVIRIDGKEKKYVWNAKILDTLKEKDSGAKSICYRSGCIYVLVNREKAEGVKRSCAAILEEKSFNPPVVLDDKAIPMIQGIIIQLLLNALPGLGRIADVNYTNLSGKMYCHHSAWDSKGVYVVLQIVVKKDYSIVLQADSFSKIPKGKDIKPNVPRYFINEFGDLQRTFEITKPDLYVDKRFDGNRATIPFMSIADEVSFIKSKMGVLKRVMDQYDKAYSSFHAIIFEDAEISERHNITKTEFTRMITGPRTGWLSAHGLSLDDSLGNDVSKAQIERIKAIFESEYQIDIKASGNGPKLRIIHDADFYKDKKDEDTHVLSDTVGVQQITLERLSEARDRGLKAIINNCINNLIIKDDIVNGKLTFGGSDLRLERDMVFGVRALRPDDKSQKPEYLFMTIHPDGTFAMENRPLVPFGDDNTELYDVLEDGKEDNIRGVIKYGYAISAIYDTGLYTMPELKSIEDQMIANASSGKTTKVERTEENREAVLVAVTDINRFSLDSEKDFLYNVGTLGSGMQTTIQTASLIRKIKVIQGEDISSLLLPMMCEGHVRNEQLTVIPFPFKYLTEFAKMNGLEIDN